MPEAPEVRTSVDFLNKYCVGWDIVTLGPTHKGRYREKLPDGLAALRKLFVSETNPFRVKEITSRGKFTWWIIRCGDIKIQMHVTYAMTGMWYPAPASMSKHSAFYMTLRNLEGDEQPLSFVDMRRFGMIKFVFDDSILETKLAGLGPDPFDGDFTPEHLFELMTKRGINLMRPICELMLDQRIFCGVGNYIRAEALWEARIHPWTPVASVTGERWNHLVEVTKSIILRSYAAGGATILTYRTPEGRRGNYEFNVYGRDDDANGRKVVREFDSQKRVIHWVPTIQR
jgi:formamidopyrimidine-DNA glycosylase